MRNVGCRAFIQTHAILESQAAFRLTSKDGGETALLVNRTVSWYIGQRVNCYSLLGGGL